MIKINTEGSLHQPCKQRQEMEGIRDPLRTLQEWYADSVLIS